MLLRSCAPLVAVLALAVTAVTAHAAPVYVVGEDGRAVLRDDPYLPDETIDCATPPDALAAAGRGPDSTGPDPFTLRGQAPSRSRARAAAGPGVRRRIAQLRRAGAIGAEEARRHRRTYAAARGARARLSGIRRSELSAVIATLERLARAGRLSADRMTPLFLTLERNTEWWSRHGPPPQPVIPAGKGPCAGGAGLGGARVTFAGDPVVFQWYSGQGLQIQQLGTFGKVNALAKGCTGEAPVRCRANRFRRGADRIADLAVDRGGFLAWEYYFAFGGGRPPWISGLAQATAMQALTRATRHFGDPRYLRTAGRAVDAFRRTPPQGVRVWGGHGNHYLLYSFSPGLRVLNGFLQALVGIYDYAEAADDDRARALFRSGDRQARREVRRGDTGAWSRYSLGGRESDLGYHKLVRDFLQSLCDRTQTRVYCATAKRFTAYMHERARVRIVSAGPPLVRFRLSKISCVTLRVSRDGRLVLERSAVLGGGTRALSWSARRKGRYTITVIAEDLNRHRTTARTTVKR